MTTLRESALRRRDRHQKHTDGSVMQTCVYCAYQWPCADYRDAQNDLDTLDQALRGDHGAYPYSPGPIRQYVYIHDPEEAS